MRESIPNHIAIIMDGNGRWAEVQGKKRQYGHEEGAAVVRTITTYANTIGLQYLTLYAFSTENWKRPKIEVDFLMKLMSRYLKKELPLYLENNVRFDFIGDISKFSNSLTKQLIDVKEQTSRCTGLTQVLALNYGSKDEIVRAVNRAVTNGTEVDEKSFNSLLDTKEMPEVDMMIRTGGDLRISNFLLWQCAYAELFFTETLWPDFSTGELEKLIDAFNKRVRRFGGL
jgi:undecaprenyl diphosphate synthase